MAYFKWFGIDDRGTHQRGICIAPSERQLAQECDEQKVKLIGWYELSAQRVPAISAAHQAQFFKHSAMLLRSGVRLHDTLLASQVIVKSDYFRAVIRDCARCVREGIALSEAFARHPQLFDEITIHLIAAGERAGALALTIEQRAVQLQDGAVFNKRLRQALFLPLLSLGMFLIIAVVFFLAVIPHFKSMLTSFNKPLPALTQHIFALSDWLASMNALYTLCAIIMIMCLLLHYKKTVSGQRAWSYFVIKIPFIGPLMRDMYMSLFFQTCSLLLTGGVRLVQAVQSSALVITHTVIREEYQACALHIASGVGVADAFVRQRYGVAHDITALLSLGETSGNLACVMAQAGELCKERVLQKLTFLTSLAQPMMLIMLGLLIALLVCSLYEPMLTISSLVE